MGAPGTVSTALRIIRAGAKWLWERIVKPKLQIVVDPEKTYDKRIIQQDPIVYGLLLHVVVRNEGSGDAKGCQGYLDRIDYWNEKEEWIQQKSYVRPDVLDWANLDFEPKVIPRKARTGSPPESTLVEGNERRLNLVETDEAWSQIFRVCTQSHGKGSKTEFPPGRYRLHVRVTSQNASTASKKVVIEAPDRWDQIHFSAL